MFLAPITLPRDVDVAPASPRSARVRNRSARVASPRRRADAPRSGPPIERTAVKRILLAWLVVGCGVALLFPQWLLSQSAGASVAFWLVGAPLVDLAWVSRADIVAACRRAGFARRPRGQAQRWSSR